MSNNTPSSQHTQSRQSAADKNRAAHQGPQTSQAGLGGSWSELGVSPLAALPYAQTGISLDQQARQIVRQDLQSAARLDLASRIGATQGNAHLSRLLQRAAANYGGVSASGLGTSYSGVIQRQDKKEREEFDTLGDQYFTAKVTSPPAVSGAYSTEKVGEGAAAILKVFSPMIEMKGKVSVAEGYKPKAGTGFVVGPIQALTSSSRVGVYSKDGKEVARYTTSLGLTRDMRPQQYAGDASQTKFKVEQPFYDRTQPITDQIWDAEVSFADRPQMSVPLEFGGGKLSRVEGSDNFVTSLGIKHTNSGAIITKSPFGWRTNWDMTLDADLGVAKDAKGDQAVKGIEQWKEQAGVVVNTETYAYERFLEQNPSFSFQTLDAAMAEAAFTLWMSLPISRQSDPASAAFIEQALKTKDPTFSVQLVVTMPASRDWLNDPGEDTIGVFANAGKQSALKGPFNLKKGGSTTVGMKMSEIMEISSINSSSKLSIWAGGHDGVPILGDFVEMSYPFLSEGNIEVSKPGGGSGTYHVKVSMA